MILPVNITDTNHGFIVTKRIEVGFVAEDRNAPNVLFISFQLSLRSALPGND